MHARAAFLLVWFCRSNSITQNMPAIGITGGVSTGKSTFCDCFGEILPAARFFDDDRVVHKLVDVPGIKKELVRECRENFFPIWGGLRGFKRMAGKRFNSYPCYLRNPRLPYNKNGGGALGLDGSEEIH